MTEQEIAFGDIREGDYIRAEMTFTDGFRLIREGIAQHLSGLPGDRQWRSGHAMRHLASESHGGMSGADVWSEKFFLLDRVEKLT